MNQPLMNKIRKLSNFGGGNAPILAKAIHAVNINFNRSIQKWPSFSQNSSFQHSLPTRNDILRRAGFPLLIQMQKGMIIFPFIRKNLFSKEKRKLKGTL